MIQTEFLIVYAVIMICDIITGLAKCYFGKSEKTKDGNFKSGTMRQCGIRKLLTLLFCVGCDVILSYYGLGVMAKSVYIYYIVADVFSVFENLNSCGIKVPNFLKKFIENVNEENNKDK